MENKNTNLKIIIAILIIIILALVTIIICNMTSNKKDVVEQNKEDNVVAEEVLNNELYSPGFNATTFIINGELYVVDNIAQYEMGALTTVKVGEIEGTVKKVKGYSIGTDPTITHFAITTEGKVYALTNSNDVHEYEIFKDYQIEDIISVEGNTWACEYKISLKDGRIFQINTVMDETTNYETKVTATEL